MSEDERDSYERDQVVEIINSVIDKVGQAPEPTTDLIHMELQSLKMAIDDMVSDLDSLHPKDIQDKHIPTATEELDAIIDATATATGTIMDACEAMTEASEGTEVSDKIVEQVTKIYEACSFQDITGQRISKVVSTLKIIEEKISRLVSLLGDAATSGGDEDTRTGDEALLNGPQMADKAITQDDIDKLLADFD